MTMAPLTVLVVGATGSIGRLVVEEALRKGYAVRALARDDRKARRLLPGAEVVVGDLTRPETLAAAVHSVGAIVFTTRVLTRVQGMSWAAISHSSAQGRGKGMENVIVVVGAGQIGQAIARRVGVEKHVVLADRSEANASAAAEVMRNAGYEVSIATVDVSSRPAVHALVEQAMRLGHLTGLIHAAGVSPSQASPETILHVDLYGTALVLEEFGSVIARGGSGVVISSQSGHRLPALSVEQNRALALTPTEELLQLPFLQLDQVKDSLHAYQLSKRGNSLRVMAEAVRWGKRGARINTISPGIIMTPLAKDELTGPRGEGYRRMIEGSVAKRAGTPDEVGAVGALLMGPDGGFITGSDFLVDGGVTAAYWYGEVAEVRGQK
jgi:NAD(P)-dependent dehydrogenase (short-subunit alcohol dehydrogenase family)